MGIHAKKIRIVLLCLTAVVLTVISTAVFLKTLPNFIHTKYGGFDVQLSDAMERQAYWIIDNQLPEGKFSYEMGVPAGNLYNSDNIVRQAGTLYSLAQYYKFSNDEKVAESLEKGISYFQDNTKEQDYGRAVVLGPVPMSNVNALLALALVEYIESGDVGAIKHKDYLSDLSRFMVSAQNLEGDYTSGGIVSDYTNGECLYSLVRAYQITGEEEFLQSAVRAAERFSNTYGRQGFNSGFFSWGMAGFYYLYEVTGEDRYWQFLNSYSEKYINARGQRYDNHIIEDRAMAPPPSASVYMEGVAHIAAASKKEDPALYEKLRAHMARTLNHLFIYEVNGPKGKITGAASYLNGGVCASYECESVRNDFNQHSISAMYLYLTLL